MCHDLELRPYGLVPDRRDSPLRGRGGAIFFVSNSHTGDRAVDLDVVTNNLGGSWYPKYPQISVHEDTKIVVTNPTIQ
jgi:hypothetical protein